MSKSLFEIEDGKFGLALEDPGVELPLAAIADYTDFSCQVTKGALTATANTDSEEIAATFCEAAETRQVVKQSTFAMEMSIFQDPHIKDGITAFFFANDTKEAWFYFGLDGDDPPKAIGKIHLVAGTVGGEARTTLTADVVLPVDGKPDIQLGDATASTVYKGDGTVIEVPEVGAETAKAKKADKADLVGAS